MIREAVLCPYECFSEIRYANELILDCAVQSMLVKIFSSGLPVTQNCPLNYKKQCKMINNTVLCQSALDQNSELLPAHSLQAALQ